MGVRFFELGGLFAFLVVAGVVWLFGNWVYRTWVNAHKMLRDEAKEDSVERQ